THPNAFPRNSFLLILIQMPRGWAYPTSDSVHVASLSRLFFPGLCQERKAISISFSKLRTLPSKTPGCCLSRTPTWSECAPNRQGTNLVFACMLFFFSILLKASTE